MEIILGSGSRWRKQLLEEAGLTFEVMTADIDEKKIRNHDPEKLVLDIAEITFYPIPNEEIDRQIKKGEIFFCSGGFQIEVENGSINPYIKTLKGTIDSVKGLPVELVKRLIGVVT